MPSTDRKAYRRELALVPLLWAGLIGYWSWRILTALIIYLVE